MSLASPPTIPPRRALFALTVLIALLLALPLFASNYIVSVMVLVLFAAYLGQAWNIMMGYVGLLSIGHALYVGLGAYTAAALFVHYGLPPWLGMLAGMAVASLAGTVIGALSFRFGLTGVYFALLTIAFAEFTRILFDHLSWVGASSHFMYATAAFTRALPLLKRTQLSGPETVW